MMNLAWLAAVLQPHDVAPHPNFPDEAYDAMPAPRLAAAIIGGSWHRHALWDRAEIPVSADADVVAIAEQTLDVATIATATPALARRVLSGAVQDAAESCTLALITCVAAAELEDYPTIWRILDDQLERLRGSDDDIALIRAALFQQKALRLQDAGEPHLPVLHLAAAALNQVDPQNCSPFPTSPGVSRGSTATVTDIRDSLRDAVASLTPTEVPGDRGALPTWQETVRARVSPVVVRVARRKAGHYASYVEQRFNAAFGNNATAVIGGPEHPDVFREVLLLELMGHGTSYVGRKELALLRLVQEESGSAQLADCVRLLRHAGARRELDLVLGRLHAAGPLSVLGAAARQVIRTRLDARLLRPVELRVLRFGAELLAPNEASTALDAVMATLRAGGPPDLPGAQQLLILRLEVGWATAAALANQCQRAEQVAALLLEQAPLVQNDDQLHDQAVARALRLLNWGMVSEPTRNTWVSVVEIRAASLPATAEALSHSLDLPVPPGTDKSHMDAIIRRLNAMLRAGVADPELAGEALEAVLQRLANTRLAAHGGSFSMGGVSEADVAAGLILHAGADALWPDLTAFLLDPLVAREDRSAAFERLARSKVELPSAVSSAFREAASQLLHAPDAAAFGSAALDPYPSALRFLACHQLISADVAYEGIAVLAASTGRTARREAAMSLAVLAPMSPTPEVIALALPLAADEDVNVRAFAGRGLAAAAAGDSPLATAARRRVSTLLNQDGVLAPLLLLRALEEDQGNLVPELLPQVTALAKEHPARSVREAAAKLAPPNGIPGGRPA